MADAAFTAREGSADKSVTVASRPENTEANLR